MSGCNCKGAPCGGADNACADPLNAQVFRRLYTAFARDTAATIAEYHGRPWSDYPDLVRCNLDRPLVANGLTGLGPTIAITKGDKLRIPASWAFAPGSLGKDLLLPPGLIKTLLEDVTLDPITKRVLDLVHRGMTGFEGLGLGDQPVVPAALETMIGNAASQWWRMDHPNEKPTPAQFLPYFDKARNWAEGYGKTMKPIDATGMPWAGIDFPSVNDYADVLQLPIDWNAVRTWLGAHMSKQDALPPPARHPDFASPSWTFDDSYTVSWPWTTTPWASIPFGKVPFRVMDLSGVRAAQNLSPASKWTTQALLDELAKVYPKGAATPVFVPVFDPVDGDDSGSPKPPPPDPCPAGMAYDPAKGLCVPAIQDGPPPQTPPPAPAPAPMSGWVKLGIGAAAATAFVAVADLVLSPSKGS